MSYYSDLVAQIKKEVEKNTYPPVYEKKLFDLSIRNCYAYALNVDVSDKKRRVLYPGCISSEDEELDIFSEKMLLERLKKDLKFLGFTYRPNDINLEDGEYRIAIYAFPAYHDMPIDFHIARQNKDGFWSEKPNWKSKPRKFDYCGIDCPELEGVETFYKTVLIIKKI